MTSNPIIADNRPKQVTLTKGDEYYTNNCPAGIATQDPELRKRLDVEAAAGKLSNFFAASIELMQVMARACGHSHLNQFSREDLATWHRDMALLSGVDYSGYGDPGSEPVGEFRRWPESEQFFRLAKTAKQSMLVVSSMQPDAARRKKGRSKPDRILRPAPNAA